LESQITKLPNNSMNRIITLLIFCFLTISCNKAGLYDDTLIFVEGGTFEMGSNEISMAKPAHEVEIDDFYIGKYEITNRQFLQFLNDYGSSVVKAGTHKDETLIREYEFSLHKDENGKWCYFPGFENHPVVNVTWYGASEFCKFYGYRLPTEAEWEFAARGGNKSHNYYFSGGNLAWDVAWYKCNSDQLASRVCQKKPNELGLYDMSGNVWEWCADWFLMDYFEKSPKKNPKGADTSVFKVVKGGSWFVDSTRIRPQNRINTSPDEFYLDFGFRIAK